jgi:hypothetical protein
MNYGILEFGFGSLDWGGLDLLPVPDIEIMPVSTQMMPTRLTQTGAASAPAACQPAAIPLSELDPLKHLLIGSPRAIQQTIHRLHNLGYADAGLWSPLMALPQPQLVITASAGEMMSLLLRSLRFE